METVIVANGISGETSIELKTMAVSIPDCTVLFLNDDYTGGALTLYGLVDDPKWRDYGFAVAPAPGLLVAFPSDMLHEVTPVIAGERCTVANWFRA